MPNIITVRAVPATIATLTTKVRRKVGDTDTTVGNQRWSNADIYDSIDGMLSQMHNELVSEDSDPYQQQLNIPYPANAASSALPPGYDANSILKVEDITSGTGIFIDYGASIDLDRFSDQYKWSFLGNNIALRPLPSSDKLLRVTFLSNYYTVSATTNASGEQHPMSANHEELLVYGSAIRLQGVDDEVSAAHLLIYQTLWGQFQKSAGRNKGRTYVQPTRVILG